MLDLLRFWFHLRLQDQNLDQIQMENAFRYSLQIYRGCCFHNHCPGRRGTLHDRKPHCQVEGKVLCCLANIRKETITGKYNKGKTVWIKYKTIQVLPDERMIPGTETIKPEVHYLVWWARTFWKEPSETKCSSIKSQITCCDHPNQEAKGIPGVWSWGSGMEIPPWIQSSFKSIVQEQGTLGSPWQCYGWASLDCFPVSFIVPSKCTVKMPKPFETKYLRLTDQTKRKSLLDGYKAVEEKGRRTVIC